MKHTTAHVCKWLAAATVVRPDRPGRKVVPDQQGRLDQPAHAASKACKDSRVQEALLVTPVTRAQSVLQGRKAMKDRKATPAIPGRRARQV